MSEHIDDFLNYFEAEISDLSEQFKEFGRKYPKAVSSTKIAGKSSDPHINLLMESFAFYSAKIKTRVEELSYAVPETVLEHIDPALIELVPSISLAKCDIDVENPPPIEGHKIPRKTLLYAVSDDNSLCNFKSCYNLDIFPIDVGSLIAEPTYEHDFWSSDVRSVLSVELTSVGCDLSEIDTEALRFFIDGETKITLKLRELLLKDLSEVYILDEASGKTISLGSSCIQANGYADDEAILDNGLSDNPGFRLLREYCIFPQKFSFFTLNKINFPRSSRTVKLLFGLKKNLPRWLSVDRLSFELNVTPLINRYEKMAEPISLEDLKTEYVIKSDLNDNKSEVIRVQNVTLSAPGIEGASSIPNIFSSNNYDTNEQLFWSTRHEKSFSSDVRSKLVIHNREPLEKRLASHVALLEVSCHNPNQAKQISPGVALFANFELPCDCHITRFPSQCHPRVQESDTLWKMANKLSASLPIFAADKDPKKNANTFIEYLSDYIPQGIDTSLNELEGIKEIFVETCVKKNFSKGATALCEEFEISIIFDEERFLEGNLFLFIELISEIFASLVSLNSFINLRTSTIQDSEEWLVWKPRQNGKLRI